MNNDHKKARYILIGTSFGAAFMVLEALVKAQSWTGEAFVGSLSTGLIGGGFWGAVIGALVYWFKNKPKSN
jgi:hypothetical protein